MRSIPRRSSPTRSTANRYPSRTARRCGCESNASWVTSRPNMSSGSRQWGALKESPGERAAIGRIARVISGTPAFDLGHLAAADARLVAPCVLIWFVHLRLGTDERDWALRPEPPARAFERNQIREAPHAQDHTRPYTRDRHGPARHRGDCRSKARYA